MNRFRTSAAGLIIVCLAALTIYVAPPADARHFEQRANVVQLNMWGMSGGGQDGVYNESIAQAVVDSINGRNPRPLSLSLQEVCKGQFDYLLYVLNQTYGYQGIMTQSAGGNLGSAYPGRATHRADAVRSEMLCSGWAGRPASSMPTGTPRRTPHKSLGATSPVGTLCSRSTGPAPRTYGTTTQRSPASSSTNTAVTSTRSELRATASTQPGTSTSTPRIRSIRRHSSPGTPRTKKRTGTG